MTEKACQALLIDALLYIVQLKPHKTSLLSKWEKLHKITKVTQESPWHQMQALYYFLC